MDDYPDLRQLIASRTPQQFGSADPFSPRPYNNYQPNNFVLGHDDQVNINAHGFGTILSNNTSSSASSVGALYSPLDLMDQHSGWNVNGNDIVGSGNNSRWPRQETLTLLEIRSSLDCKFKETNQKGPLWDEVSRIMGDEHGYQRSGKKCKEKFENLYKYYKKTKEGKAGRQDGKHYRFFRQLEAIYGDHQSNVTDQSGMQNPTLVHNHTPPDRQHGNSADFETSTSENEKIYDIEKIRSNSAARSGAKKRWKAKVEEFVSSQMRKMMKAQEGWMENVLKSIEAREEEMLAREEELRNREQAERFNRQVHEFWAKERAWVETRDASIMEAVNQIKGGGEIRGNKNEEEDMGLQLPSCSNHMNVNSNSFYIPINQGENLWNRYGVKIDQQGISMTRQK